MSSPSDARFTTRPPAPCRVLHVVESWAPRPAGYATRSWQVVATQEERPGLAPRVLVTSRQHTYGLDHATPLPDSSASVTLVPPSRRERRLRALRAFYTDGSHLEAAICRQHRHQPVDVLHSHWSSTIGMATARAARRLGLPFVAEVRFDLAGAMMTETVEPVLRALRLSLPTDRMERLLRRWFERHLVHADVVCAASYALADLLAASFPAVAGRLVVVPNGVDADRFRPGPPDAALRARLGLPEGALVVGSTTNMLRYEGLDLLLDAVRALGGCASGLHVLLVGDGTQRASLEAAARTDALPVTFTGRVPRADVPRYLRLLDAFVVPRRAATITRYASPIKVAEAMASELPVVASAVGDLPHLLGAGRGVLLPPGDVPRLAEALRALREHPAAHHRLGQAARTWAATHLRWSTTAARYEAAYATARTCFFADAASSPDS